MKTQAGGYNGKKKRNMNPHQAALNWVLSNKNITAAIPSMITFEQLEENFAAASSKMGWLDRKTLDLYGHNKKGCKMIKFFWIILTSLLLASAANSSAAKVQTFLPQPDFEPGWKWDFKPEIYTAENLFEYIDGEAELYNDYHFVEMATASYALQSDESVTFTIDVYDMGTPLNAFGIYSSYRRPELVFASIGKEAIVSDLNIRFYKGKYFVQLNAGSTNPRAKSTIHNLALTLADTFPNAPQPKEISLLPIENQVPHSLKYITKGFMGQSAFGPVMQAKYQSGFAAFVVINKSEKESNAAVKIFRENIAKRGKIINSSERTLLKFSAKTPYQGNIVAQGFKNYILGISGYKDQQKADEMLKKIIAGL